MLLLSEFHKYRKGWRSGLPETECGYGSRLEATEVQRQVLPQWAAQYGWRSIVDIGAGDLNWMRLIEWPHEIEYTGLDLVPRAEGVREFDLIYEIPPKADVALCIWVLNHLPPLEAAVASLNLRDCGAEWVVYTWFPRMEPFLDWGYIERADIRVGYPKQEGPTREKETCELRLARLADIVTPDIRQVLP